MMGTGESLLEKTEPEPMIEGKVSPTMREPGGT